MIKVEHLAQFLSAVFIASLILMIVPWVALVYYLAIRLKNINGELGKVREIMFRVGLADFIFLSIIAALTTFSSIKRVNPNSEVSIVGIIFVLITLAVGIVHWWALVRIRKLVNK